MTDTTTDKTTDSNPDDIDESDLQRSVFNASITNSGSDKPLCRFCFKTLHKQEYFKPCLCNSYVHRKCLDKWLIEKPSLECEVCLYKFKTRQHYDYMSCTFHITRFIMYWIVTILLNIVTAATPLIIIISYTFVDIVGDTIKHSDGKSMRGIVIAATSTAFVILIIISVCLLWLYDEFSHGYICLPNTDPCSLTNAPFIHSNLMYGLIIIAEIITFGCTQLLGVGVYNLITYGNIVYEFNPRFETFWIGFFTIILLCVVCLLIVGIYYMGRGLVSGCKSILGDYKTDNRIENV
jgi:hypothetical protein